MKLRTALFAAAATLALAPAAHAYQGLYGSIGAGLSYLGQDLDFEVAPDTDGDADYDSGIGIYTAVGYDYGNNWRAELEFSYRANDLRHIAGQLPFAGFNDTDVVGDLNSYTFFGNLIRDLKVGPSWVKPYVGVGVGVQFADLSASGSNVAGSFAVSDTNARFVGQGIGGLAFAIAENLSLDLSYRYVIGEQFNFEGDFDGSSATFGHENRGHNLFAGLRWNFGAAAPAPAKVSYKDCWDGSSVPTTSECPPQQQETTVVAAEPLNIIVYFDYDKSNLTPEAADLIRETSARALQNNIQRVKVEGNADRSGGSAYNAALSQRRANVVRDALIANGVAADRIDTSSFGEDNPAKPTADGVREPLNRRTEVKISFQ